jgi:sulfoxide reductase heme-binding subunit YedZ
MRSPASTRAWIWRSSIKALLVLALASPLAWLGWLVYLDLQAPGAGLGPDAGEALVQYLGEWSLRMLLLAFAVTPLRHWSGSTFWIRNRRMVGLFAFTYVCLHVTSYLGFYLGFAFDALLEDIVERPYITMGMVAFACLIPMALTSTQGWRRRLRHHWQRLHRLIYVALGAGLLHLWWLTRDGFLELLVYTLCFGVLCLDRMRRSRRGRLTSGA